MHKKTPCLALGLLAAIASGVSGDVVTIGASHDATIYSNNPNNSNGGGPGIFSGTDGGPQSLRGLMSFDIADNVPAGSTITGVQLTLILGMAAGSGGGGGGGGDTGATIELHRITDSWGEGNTESSSTVIGGTGQGAPANPGDATWDARFYSSTTPTLWTTPGGDYVAAASGSDAVGSTSGEADVWSSTAGMVADVQSWLDTPATNYGWELINTDETDTRTFRAYWTHEAILATNRPQLQITFTPVPEPAGVAVVSLLGISLRRRRCSV